MYSIALFPLGLYFWLLAWFYSRNRPTVLTGVQDLMLLASGLYGLFVAGPGRLIVPVFVWEFWDFAAWIYLTAFYFVVAYLVAIRLTPRYVIYGCNKDLFISKLHELGLRMDPRASHLGNVLTLPEKGVQFSIRKMAGGACTQLEATGPYQDASNWKRLGEKLAGSYQDLPKGIRFQSLKYLLLAVGTLVASILIFRELECQSFWESADRFLIFDIFRSF